MGKRSIYFFVSLLIFILSFAYIYAKNDNLPGKININNKYSGQKLEKIKKSIKQKKFYRFLIESNTGLSSIEEYFNSQDKKIQIKQMGNNSYMLKIPLNSEFLQDELSQIDGGILPEKIGGYRLIEPELVESFTTDYLSGELLDNLWGIQKIGAQNFQEELSTKEKIKVAILDTGIDYNHIDLNDNYNSELSYDFVNEDTDALDDNGHGTQVAGIIGAEVNSAGRFGVNSNSDLIGLKVLDSNGLGTSYDILEAIDYAKANGIKVLNMSFGGLGTIENNPICEAISDAKNNGIFSVVSAGNNNSEISNLIPAGCSDSITVGAVDNLDNKAEFSNYGTGVLFYAPGVDIYTTSLNNLYQNVSGTSFSAAFVSGLVSKELAFSGNISYDDLLCNLESGYGLLNTYNYIIETNEEINSNLIEFASGVYIQEENYYLYERFDDFKYLYSDSDFIYYIDKIIQNKIYRLKINSNYISSSSDFYKQFPEIAFSDKRNFYPLYFASGEHINLNYKSLSNGIDYKISEINSIEKYDLQLKFEKIYGEKSYNTFGPIILTDELYVYYINNNDNRTLYRIKKDGTQNIKILDYNYVYPKYVDELYLYYNNPQDNYKLYRIKKDGSELGSFGTKITELGNTWFIGAYGEYLFYINVYDQRKIYRVKKDGTESNTSGMKILDISSSNPNIINGDYLYYLNSLDGFKLYRILTDGSELETNGTKVLDIKYVYPAFIDNYNIFFKNFNVDNYIYKVNLDGSGLVNFINFNVSLMYQDLNYIYYNYNGLGYKIKKNGTDLGNGIKIFDGSIPAAVYDDIENLYYIYYNNIEFICLKFKKDGTSNIFDIIGGNIDIGLFLEGGINNIRVKVDSFLPNGTDYTLSISNDFINYINIPISNLLGNTDLNLTNLFGELLWDGDGLWLIFKIDMFRDFKNFFEEPIINTIEIFNGENIPSPIILKQYVQSPGLEREEFGSGTEIGVKVGKFQSGTGIILSSYIDNTTNTSLKLAVEIYEVANLISPKHIGYSNNSISSGNTGNLDVIIPYSYLGAGNYYWKAKVIDDIGNESELIDFENINPFETDFTLYEGFEPYPYGYSFYNRSPEPGFLTGDRSPYNWIHCLYKIG